MPDATECQYEQYGISQYFPTLIIPLPREPVYLVGCGKACAASTRTGSARPGFVVNLGGATACPECGMRGADSQTVNLQPGLWEPSIVLKAVRAMVRAVGLEPTRAEAQGILSPFSYISARLRSVSKHSIMP